MTREALRHLYLFILLYRFALGCLELLCYSTYRWLQDRRRNRANAARDQISVAIVCATVSGGISLKNALPTWQQCRPNEIWIVTDANSHAAVSDALAAVQNVKVSIITCDRTNKRAQLCQGFKRTTSDVIVICDDDTIWTPSVLCGLTACFQDNKTLGAAFPEVKFRSARNEFNLWESLSASRLAGDQIDIRTSMLIDGGVFCASGTTAAYRGDILRDPSFLQQFPSEKWLGRVLNAGDDQSLTLWLAEKDWNLCVVPDDGPSGFCVLTTPRTTWRHIPQLIRWSRSDWQACISATVLSSAVWRKHPFTAWTRMTWCIGSFSFVVELLYLYLNLRTVTILEVVTLQASRLIRLLPYFITSPTRLKHLVTIAAYLYLCQIIRVYSLLTIGNTNWS
ncbi:nucleotide-diphospho-sugar transferase [Clohesyomyces aquaticus]|uniref:Nucleotide-diphospho-sugar transferase n=1 Tax=Clohesyomyces aquaticus TaxID=1231657 RepID=A0A1Y1ZHU9_9PLEO|nr:nucleotide-diphospho-sugar transferase [Clohesyomyces aquaticus]